MARNAKIIQVFLSFFLVTLFVGLLLIAPEIERELSKTTLRAVKNKFSSNQIQDFYVSFNGQQGLIEGVALNHKIKNDIEQLVRKVDGVERVTNLIEVESRFLDVSNQMNQVQKKMSIHVARPNAPKRIRRVITTKTVKTIKRVPSTRRNTLGGLR